MMSNISFQFGPIEHFFVVSDGFRPLSRSEVRLRNRAGTPSVPLPPLPTAIHLLMYCVFAIGTSARLLLVVVSATTQAIYIYITFIFSRLYFFMLVRLRRNCIRTIVIRKIAQIAIVVPTMTVLALGDAIALLAVVPALIDTSVLDLPMIIPIQTPVTLVPF